MIDSLPKIAFWNLLILFFYLIFNYYILPRLIKYAVEKAPLEAPDAELREFKLLALDNVGLKLFIDSSISGSKIPSLSWLNFWIRLRLSQICIKEAHSKNLLGYLNFSNPIIVSTTQDIDLVQTIRFDFHENASALKSIVQRFSVVGKNELKHISVRISFRLNISILDVFVLEDVDCGKTINLEELRLATIIKKNQVGGKSESEISTIHDSMNSSSSSENLLEDNNDSRKTLIGDEDKFDENEVDDDDTPDMDQTLLPNPEINVFANRKGLRSVEAGLEIEFSKPPKLNFQFGTISFTLMLHGSQFAKVKINGLSLFDNSRYARLIVEVSPSALSDRPITGAVTSMKGVIKGVLKGAVNGLIHGDWGAQAMILGVKDIEIRNERNREVWWIKELLTNIEIEHDLDAVRKVKTKIGKKTGNFQSALSRMWKAALFPV